MRRLLTCFSFCSLIFFNGNHSGEVFIPSYDEHGPWKLIKEDGHLKIYKRNRSGSSLKEVRIDNVFFAPAEKLIGILDDADTYVDWIYKCSESEVLGHPADDEIIYYTVADLPSPVWDRDIVAQSIYEYFPEEKKHYYVSHVPENHEELKPKRSGKQRVTDYSASWTIYEVEEERLEIINTVYFDPGGSIPNWLTNMTLTKGPTKSMAALRKKLEGE